MTKDIPKMDDLIKGINDPDMLLTDEPQGISDATDKEQEESANGSVSMLSPDADGSRCWRVFMNYLDNSDERNDKDERLVCKLDRDLADSLDDCDIHNRSRSDLVNAIVRAFFEIYLPQLSEFRRKKKSLFITFNKEDYEVE